MVQILGWALAVLVGFQQPAPRPGSGQARQTPKSILAVYEGTLPCADCAGIRAELTILGKSASDLVNATYRLDAAYRLYETYLQTRDGDRPFRSSGRLVVHKTDGSGRPAVVYELRPDRGTDSRYFELVTATELRQLDRTMLPIVKTPGILTRRELAAQMYFLPVPTTSRGVKAIAQFAVTEAGRQSGKRILLRNIAEAERQSSAGSVYRVCIEAVADKADVRALALVTQGLNAKLTLRSWTPGGC